jgi:hypothetical protein
MIDYGLHESLVWEELARLPLPLEKRARQQLTEFLAQANVMADARLRFVKIAPSGLRSLAEQFGAEADRLFELDDPIAPVFDAWSQSARLADQIWKMEPADIEWGYKCPWRVRIIHKILGWNPWNS